MPCLRGKDRILIVIIIAVVVVIVFIIVIAIVIGIRIVSIIVKRFSGMVGCVL